MSQFQQPSFLQGASQEIQDFYNQFYGGGGNNQQQNQGQQGPFSPTPINYQYGQDQQMGPFGPGTSPTPGYGTTPTSLYGENPQNTMFGQNVPSFFMSDQLASAALGDYQNLINAEQFNRENANRQIEQMGQLLGQVPGVIQGTAAQQAQGLRDQASGFAESFEEEAKAARDAYKETLATRQGEIEDAIAGFEKTTQAEMSAAALGVDRSTQSMMNQINSGINPDGTMMTPAQKQAATAQATFQNAQMRQAALAPMVTQFERDMLGAEMQGAQMKAGLDQQGFAADQSTLQAMQVAASFEASAYESAAAMENAAATQATQFLLTGQQNMYEMYKTNPYAPVALFDTLAAIYSIKMNEPMFDFAKVDPLTGDFFNQGLGGQLPVS